MRFDRADYKELQKRKARSDFRVVEQAAVDKQRLTGSPEWDIFLQQLQSSLDEAKGSLESHLAMMGDPTMTDDQLRALNNKISILNERVGTIDSIMNLPLDIIKKGEDARLTFDDDQQNEV